VKPSEIKEHLKEAGFLSGKILAGEVITDLLTQEKIPIHEWIKASPSELEVWVVRSALIRDKHEQKHGNERTRLIEDIVSSLAESGYEPRDLAKLYIEAFKAGATFAAKEFMKELQRLARQATRGMN